MPEKLYRIVVKEIKKRYPDIRSSTRFENFKATEEQPSYIGSVLVGPPYVFNVYENPKGVTVFCEGDGNEFVVKI